MPVMEKRGVAGDLSFSPPFGGSGARVVPDGSVVSKSGVVYYPFSSEEEVGEWMGNVVSEWWDDETV